MCDNIGAYTYGSPTYRYGQVPNHGKYKCGKFCSFGKNIEVYLGGNHRVEWTTAYPFGAQYTDIFNSVGMGTAGTKGDVIIGNDVWVADNVVIMSGLIIGDGAIIANNSHVVKNVAPYSIVGGNPAALIRYRFTDVQISKLLEIKWWDWPDEKINTFLPLMCNTNIDEFINSAINNNI